MADIKPFRAFRPCLDKVSSIAALPYDVYNRQEAREIVEANPDSFLAIDRPETFFEPDHDMYAPEVYERASKELWGRICKGDFIQDDDKCYYIYELTMDGRSQTGIVAVSSIDDYLNNIIKKHENTRADKEKDRIEHVYACHAQTGPIFLCYRRNEIISQIIDRVKEMDDPAYDFESADGVRQRVWVMEDEEENNMICRIFTSINEIYIADGHHRCASAVKVGLRMREEKKDLVRGKLESDYFLSVLFPDSELMIMDYNRVVKDLNGLSSGEFLDELGKKFDIKKEEEPVKPGKKGEFGMFLDDCWYRLVAHEDILKDDPVEGLDVSVLQNEVLAPVLGIADPKTDKRIDFVGGIRGLKELERRCHNDMKVAFSMYPTGIDELFSVADAGLLMPPKSTWFEPKLLSGLFIHDISGVIL
jgi:uncharacterized protein (DUF1015 family)